MHKILLVEDDPALANGLVVFLEDEGFEVVHFSDGRAAFNHAQHERFDAMILDLMLPGKSGEDICAGLRKLGIDVPILMLTSKNRVEEKVHGLTLGADDYLTKPFDLTEFVARLRALLRRPRDFQIHLNTYRFEDVVVDFDTLKIIRDDQEFGGTAKEFEVLRFLIQNERKLISRDDLLTAVWGKEAFPTPRTVDNFILSLRKKIEKDPSRPIYLRSVYGGGYQFFASPSEKRA